MQDPEIQNILTDPVMRQVCLVLKLCFQYMRYFRSNSTTLVHELAIKNLINVFAFSCRYWLISRKIQRPLKNTPRIQWWWTKSRSWLAQESSKWDDERINPIIITGQKDNLKFFKCSLACVSFWIIDIVPFLSLNNSW